MRRCESLSSFGAASLQYQPSVFGRHTRAEAVGFCASPVVRLKSAFRHSDEFSSKTKTLRLAFGYGYVKKACINRGVLRQFNACVFYSISVP